MSLVYMTCPVTRKLIVSLTATVAEMVKERGRATVNDLAPVLPDFTRDQIIQALQNAKRLGQLNCDSGRRPATYFLPGKVTAARPPASAWELGADLSMPGGWPPPAEGRRYQLLGSWTD